MANPLLVFYHLAFSFTWNICLIYVTVGFLRGVQYSTKRRKFQDKKITVACCDYDFIPSCDDKEIEIPPPVSPSTDPSV